MAGVVVFQRRKRSKMSAREGTDGTNRSHRSENGGNRTVSATTNPVFVTMGDRDLSGKRGSTLLTSPPPQFANSKQRTKETRAPGDYYDLPDTPRTTGPSNRPSKSVYASTLPSALGGGLPLGTDGDGYEVPVPVYAEPANTAHGRQGRKSSTAPVALDRDLYVSQVEARPSNTAQGRQGRKKKSVVALDRDLYVSGAGDAHHAGARAPTSAARSPTKTHRTDKGGVYATTVPSSQRVNIGMGQGNPPTIGTQGLEGYSVFMTRGDDADA